MNRKILNLLIMNGKMNYREIASTLKRSPSTVRDRISRMEKDGIIRGYITLFDPQRIGMNVEAIILAEMEDGITYKEFERLREVEGVLEVLYVSGERQIMVRMEAPDIMALEEKVSDEIIPKGLKNVDMKIVIRSLMRFQGISLEKQ